MRDDLIVLALALAAAPTWLGYALLAVGAVGIGVLWWAR